MIDFIDAFELIMGLGIIILVGVVTYEIWDAISGRTL